MNIVNITLGVDTQPCSSITLGRRGENEVTQVVVDFSSWVEEFGAGVITLLAMRSQDTSAYPVVLSLDGNTATWDVTSTDTAYKGSGRAEYIYTVGEQIAKSVVFNTVVMQDIGEPSETPPDPYEDWLERLTELGAETQANAEAAQQSAENAAESAEDAAQSAASVEGAVEQAEAARDAAMAAQTASEAAQSAAEDAAEDAQQAAQQAHVEYEQLSGEVDDLSDEVAQQKSVIDDLSALVDRKAGMLVDTASGSIASFVPDSTIDNLLGVTVDIEPIQDLHGFDSPWPAGGGKNKLASNATKDVTIAGPQTIVVSLTKNVAEITIDRDLTTSIGYRFNDGSIEAVLPAGGYFFSSNITNQQPGSGGLFIFDASTATILGRARAEGGAYISLSTETTVRLGLSLSARTKAGVYWFQIEAGSTPTAYAPFENLCPISGWDAVEVEAAGINIFDDAALVDLGGVMQEDGSVYFENSNLIYNKTIWSNPSGYAGQLAITLKRKSTGAYSTGRLAVRYTDGTTTNIGDGVDVANEFNTYTLVTPSTKSVASITGTYGTNREFYWYVQIEPGSTLHEYHPYAGNRYTIQLGQAVYGCRLTINENGVAALVDRIGIPITETTPITQWIQSADGYIYIASPDLSLVRDGVGYDAIISNCYKIVNPNGMGANSHAGEAGIYVSGTNRRIQIASAQTTVADFKAEIAQINPLFVIPLQTPVEIALDPVTISTISGQTNNVWADAGDVAVEFAADLKTYIDSKIAAAVAAMS